MPDHAHNTPATQTDWSGAFASLPLETPPADGWQRIATRLPAPAKAPARWPYWTAMAAALAMVAIVPLKLLPTDPATTPASDPIPAPMTTAAASERVAIEPEASSPSPAVVETTEAGTTTETAVARETPRQAEPEAAASQPTVDADAARIAAVDSATTTTDAGNASEPVPDNTASHGATLERLYSESAQLETLLALARDDSVSTGTAATLASGYDAQVASIDAALIQPGIDEQARTSLWNRRVDVLRQAATFETTRRMLAAQGERYDAMLVSID